MEGNKTHPVLTDFKIIAFPEGCAFAPENIFKDKNSRIFTNLHVFVSSFLCPSQPVMRKIHLIEELN